MSTSGKSIIGETEGNVSKLNRDSALTYVLDTQCLLQDVQVAPSRLRAPIRRSQVEVFHDTQSPLCPLQHIQVAPGAPLQQSQ